MSDGGFAHENIPLFPLLQPSRKLDSIIAIDSVSFVKRDKVLVKQEADSA